MVALDNNNSVFAALHMHGAQATISALPVEKGKRDAGGQKRGSSSGVWGAVEQVGTHVCCIVCVLVTHAVPIAEPRRRL